MYEYDRFGGGGEERRRVAVVAVPMNDKGSDGLGFGRAVQWGVGGSETLCITRSEAVRSS